MIDRIKIRGLKSIYEMDVLCKKMNLIVGVNSSGKSTLLQAILLFAQSCFDFLDKNRNFVSLGEWREVLNHYMTNSLCTNETCIFLPFVKQFITKDYVKTQCYSRCF